MRRNIGKRPVVRNIVAIVGLALALTAIAVQITTSSDVNAVGPGQRVSVIDGDTLELNGKIIQLYGIDAPELGQVCIHNSTVEHCGLSSAFELKKLLSIEHVPLECRPTKAADDPSLEVCVFGHTDIARVLLEDGYAVTTPNTSPDYAEAEDSARQGAMGLWHQLYVEPAEWRAGKRLAAETSDSRAPCPIKAVVAPDNRRLYFVPTDPEYETIEVDPAKGDKLFCSDEEVRRGGWRREGEKD